MDAGINPTTGDLTGQRINTLANAVYIRLVTPLGTWLADPTLGSRLHELRREKDRPRVGILAKQYAKQALQPLLNDGRARKISISAEQPHNGWLVLHAEIIDATGNPQVFRQPVRVIWHGLLPPPGDYYVWRDDGWQLDVVAQKQAKVVQVLAERDGRLGVAQMRIAPLQYAANLEMATEQEKEALLAWMRYSVDLNRMEQQPGYPFTITWPVSPA
ncbi:tail fiber assembly protein [Pseudomonas sp. GT1P32]